MLSGRKKCGRKTWIEKIFSQNSLKKSTRIGLSLESDHLDPEGSRTGLLQVQTEVSTAGSGSDPLKFKRKEPRPGTGSRILTFVVKIFVNPDDFFLVLTGPIRAEPDSAAAWLLLQHTVEVLSLLSDDVETDDAGPGENLKLRLKGIEEEEILPGFILCSPDNLCHSGRTFDAQVSPELARTAQKTWVKRGEKIISVFHFMLQTFQTLSAKFSSQYDNVEKGFKDSSEFILKVINHIYRSFHSFSWYFVDSCLAEILHSADFYLTRFCTVKNIHKNVNN